MTNEKIIRKISIFSGKVKAASNISTLLFLAAFGYCISQWHRVSGFDNFINTLIAFMLLTINIKFYRIHLSLSNIAQQAADSGLSSEYQIQKKEYSQLVFMTLCMLAALEIFNLIS